MDANEVMTKAVDQYPEEKFVDAIDPSVSALAAALINANVTVGNVGELPVHEDKPVNKGKKGKKVTPVAVPAPAVPAESKVVTPVENKAISATMPVVNILDSGTVFADLKAVVASIGAVMNPAKKTAKLYKEAKEVLNTKFKAEYALAQTRSNLLIQMNDARRMIEANISELQRDGVVVVPAEVEARKRKLDPQTTEGKAFIEEVLTEWSLAVLDATDAYEKVKAFDLNGKKASAADVIHYVWGEYENAHKAGLVKFQFHPDDPRHKGEIAPRKFNK